MSGRSEVAERYLALRSWQPRSSISTTSSSSSTTNTTTATVSSQMLSTVTTLQRMVHHRHVSPCLLVAPTYYYELGPDTRPSLLWWPFSSSITPSDPTPSTPVITTTTPPTVPICGVKSDGVFELPGLNWHQEINRSHWNRLPRHGETEALHGAITVATRYI
jgi:hypothetical protein